MKLARVLCTQFRSKIKVAHDSFLSALDKLDNFHANRLSLKIAILNTIKGAQKSIVIIMVWISD